MTTEVLIEEFDTPGFAQHVISEGIFELNLAPEGLWQSLFAGNDNLASLTPDNFVGVDDRSGSRTGIQALEDIEDISICMVPGIWAGTVRSAFILHCEPLRYRIAIVDPPRTNRDLEIEEIRSFRAPMDTKYGALYYPRIVACLRSFATSLKYPPQAIWQEF